MYKKITLITSALHCNYSYANAEMIINPFLPVFFLLGIAILFALSKMNSFRLHKLGLGGDVTHIPRCLTDSVKYENIEFKYKNGKLIFVFNVGTLNGKSYNEKIERVKEKIAPHKLNNFKWGFGIGFGCRYADFVPDIETVSRKEFVEKNLVNDGNCGFDLGVSGITIYKNGKIYFTLKSACDDRSEIQITKCIRSSLLFAYDINNIRFDGGAYTAELLINNR